jgi:hypothetical protein
MKTKERGASRALFHFCCTEQISMLHRTKRMVSGGRFLRICFAQASLKFVHFSAEQISFVYSLRQGMAGLTLA